MWPELLFHLESLNSSALLASLATKLDTPDIWRSWLDSAPQPTPNPWFLTVGWDSRGPSGRVFLIWSRSSRRSSHHCSSSFVFPRWRFIVEDSRSWFRGSLIVRMKVEFALQNSLFLYAVVDQCTSRVPSYCGQSMARKSPDSNRVRHAIHIGTWYTFSGSTLIAIAIDR